MTASAPPVAALPADARARFRANLAALATHQPDLARRLAELEKAGGLLPADARIAPGRDGAPVGILGAAGDSVPWLGGTSMPTISAVEVLRARVEPGVSVALASVGSGHEAPLLAARLAPHAAVFVCTDELPRLALALHAADWSAELRAGRIVVLAGETEGALTAFIGQNPGFPVPARVQSLPDVAPTDFAERAAAVQRGAQRADAAQQRLQARLAEQVARRSARHRAGAPPRVLVISTDAVGGGAAFAADAERGLSTAGCSVRRCAPDGPQNSHRVARLAALRDHDPDWVLWINGTPAALRDCWPADLPCACWFLESATLPAKALAGLADLPEKTQLWAASIAVRDVLAARGARAVEVLEPGADHRQFRPLPAGECAGSAACAVAVFHDGCDLAPAASNIGLESHERLWSAAIELVAGDLAANRKTSPASGQQPADDLLARAERTTGVTLSDPALRREFATLLAARVIGTVTAREVIRALQSAGTVGLWGAGWENCSEANSVHRGPIPAPFSRNGIYQDAQVVVFPHFDAAAARHALEVIASGGCPVLFCVPQNAFDNYPQAGPLLASLPTAGTLRQLTSLVRNLTSSASQRASAVQTSRAELLSKLTLAGQLRKIHDHCISTIS